MVNVFLSQMSLDDFSAYLDMKSDREDVLMSGFATAPSREALLRWFEVEIRKPEIRLLVARLIKTPSSRVGYIFLRPRVSSSDVEISYGVHARYRGQRIGQQVVALAVNYIRDNFPDAKNAICWVADDNVASTRNIVAAGYVDTGDTRDTSFMSPAPHTKTMRRFVHPILR